MKTTVAAVCWCSVFAILPTCVSAKPLPLEAPDAERGVIGVKISVLPPARIGSTSASEVYFVRLTEDADRFHAESMINSNYSKGSHVYLLNAKPGRYVAVGCSFTMPNGAQAAVVFDEADIVKTEVEIQPGSVVFMGDIDAQSSTKTKDSDEAQAHYLRMIAPTAANQTFMARAFTGHYVYTAVFKTIVRTDPAALEFWTEAGEKHFKNDPEWKSRVRNVAGAH